MGLVINAPNVHSGGGHTLLTAILDSLDRSFQGHLVLDERMGLPEGLPDTIMVHRITPTIVGRLLGERRLQKIAGPDDLVLCFGNLPPLFKLPGKIILMIQNRYQIERRSLKGFLFFHRLKIMIERLWFAWGKRNVTHFVVQTPSMQRAVRELLGTSPAILPFVKNPKDYKRAVDSIRVPNEEKFDFAYIASGEPHKNHKNLIEAWALLAEEGIRPSLCLTLNKSRFSDLCAWVERKKKALDLDICNLGTLSNRGIQGLYKEVLALIYPSDLESFGLPLIEARCLGLPVLASERDYVRDVIDPEQTFDPSSPISIARAVKRFLGIPEPPLPIMDAKTYLIRVYDIAWS